MTQIWVDGDSCPVVIKEIIYRGAHRKGVLTIFVANQLLRLPPSPWLSARQVPQGFDVADNYILQHMAPYDLVITADIPLAAEAVHIGALCINPRGQRYDRHSIADALSRRNASEERRSAGMETSGPAPLQLKDRQRFANAFSHWLDTH